MKNLARWLKFLLLAGVLFVPAGCGWVFWHDGHGRDRDDRRGGDDRRDKDGRRDAGDQRRAEDEKTKDRAKERAHEDEGRR